MELQALIFPNVRICSAEKLYYRSDQSQIQNLYAHGACVIQRDENIQFNTYFNCFSVAKWKKYTTLQCLKLSLQLQGDCIVTLSHVYKVNNTIIEDDLEAFHVTSDEPTEHTFTFPNLEAFGLFYFSVTAIDQPVYLFGGRYITDPITNLPDIHIAIDICTYRREAYITKNLSVLRETILDNPDSPANGHLSIFVADNAQTLPNETGNHPNIFLFPNRNLGGAGGFTRCMLEISKLQAEQGFTHILMMDDDILLDPAVVVRSYNFLRFLKEEYREAFLGGSMLLMNQKNVQREAADHYNLVRHHAVKPFYDLCLLNMLIKNEVEDSVNYLSWWYCCMPLSIVTEKNLPLPIFIKRDDIEYGLRNGKCFITLNGIGVWHEDFEFKRSSYLEYYYTRNTCIMNAIHRPQFNRKKIGVYLTKHVLVDLLRYRYSDANLRLMGVADFCKGIDWLITQDGEKLNQLIMACAYSKKNVEDIPYVFVHGAFERSLKYSENKLLKIVRLCSLNGWLLPAKGTKIVPANMPRIASFYRARRIINYEDSSGMAFETFKSYKYLFIILWRLLKQLWHIQWNYNKARDEYASRSAEITNAEFWNSYLFEPGEVDVSEKKPLAEFVPSWTRRHNGFLKLAFARFMRFMQYCLFFVPLKKNRVLFYLKDRAGLACNPKYVIEYLHKHYKNSLELILVTDYPDSLEEDSQPPCKIVSQKSWKYFWYFLTSKVVVTNDAHREYLLKRRKQKAVNTWHGGINYKHIGLKYLARRTKSEQKVFQLANWEPDFYVSGSAAFTADTAKSFGFNPAVFHSCGLPRNDVFFRDQSEIITKVKTQLGIPEQTHIVLFAPTFRRGFKSSTYGLDFALLRQALANRFGGKWVVLFRSHSFVHSHVHTNQAIDVSAYPDMQELLCASDVLISDYSSCMWDFSITHKPCLVFASDLETYQKNDRDFAIPIDQWPYPLSQNNQALADAIAQFNEEEYTEKLTQHHQTFGLYDKGNASQTVGEWIASQCKMK